MIRAKHSKFFVFFFNWYISRIIHSHFRRVVIVGQIKPEKRPILLVPNHFSWWDGFIAWHLNEVQFKRKYHVMMLEEQLEKHGYFTKIGAFSVRPGSRGVMESLNYCKSIMTDGQNLLVFFPQGELASQHEHNVVFRAGIERIMQANSTACIILVVALVDYFGHKKPTLVINQKEYMGRSSVTEIQNAYNDFMQECISKQNNHFSK